MASPQASTLKRLPRVWAAVTFLLLMALVFVLFQGRKTELVRPDALLAIAPAFYSHVSNFSISYVLCAGIGYPWLMMGSSMAAVLWLGLAGVLANIVYEGFIPILNTPDFVDAWYGIAGCVLGVSVLAVIERWGLVANPASEKEGTSKSQT
jgi:hypothetical protein